MSDSEDSQKQKPVSRRPAIGMDKAPEDKEKTILIEKMKEKDREKYPPGKEKWAVTLPGGRSYRLEPPPETASPTEPNP